MHHLHNSIQDNAEAFEKYSKRPCLALPTLLLWLVAVSLWLLGTGLGLRGELAYGWVFLINTAAVFLSFTVMHEASHRSISSTDTINTWMGQMSSIFITPAPLFGMFRYVHMQHHRFTNESEQEDPDYWMCLGPKPVLPLKWAFVDYAYMFWYIGRWDKLGAQQKQQFKQGLCIAALVLIVCVWQGFLLELLLYHVLPARLALVLLVWVFDYLPHYPHNVRGKVSPYQATNIRMGAEWLLTPLLQYQNYHLVHHIYPLVPFYRYGKIWQAKQRSFLDNNANRVKAFSGKPIDMDSGKLSIPSHK